MLAIPCPFWILFSILFGNRQSTIIGEVIHYLLTTTHVVHCQRSHSKRHFSTKKNDQEQINFFYVLLLFEKFWILLNLLKYLMQKPSTTFDYLTLYNWLKIRWNYPDLRSRLLQWRIALNQFSILVFVWQISYPSANGASLGSYFWVKNLTSA